MFISTKPYEMGKTKHLHKQITSMLHKTALKTLILVQIKESCSQKTSCVRKSILLFKPNTKYASPLLQRPSMQDANYSKCDGTSYPILTLVLLLENENQRTPPF
ncbi:hypothetical protein TNIN_384381 [Trichonephila inaurata madagascariensis]|uniref:Uncharacterized protein n=1 Tax=Trichonephila inaurata madagascariensis TaxID=2747483 RepID=A0A8X6XDZ0_9ARAC|nr:hypothetical protein TNIN_384381 [Trichonephila inaurata madagascariensis]